MFFVVLLLVILKHTSILPKKHIKKSNIKVIFVLTFEK